jgi:hypothetical protein
MTARTGEKLGWIGGWTGSFLWAGILTVIFLFHQQWVTGIIGLALTVIAAILIFALAPWRHPDTTYRQLMIPAYLLLFILAAWAIWAFGGVAKAGLSWWNLGVLLPVLIPLGSIGKRRWRDGETSSPDTTTAGVPTDDVPCRS